MVPFLDDSAKLARAQGVVRFMGDSTSETWNVEIAEGEVRSMTLDELDALYQDGGVGDETKVRRAGSAWTTLGSILDGDASTPSDGGSLAPIAIPMASNSSVETSADGDEVEPDARPAFRSSRKPLLFAAGAVALAVVGIWVGATAYRAPATSETAGKATSNANAPAEATDLPAESVPKQRLTEEQKRALLEADKRRAEEGAPRKVNLPRPAPSPKSKAPVRDVERYDPLNGNL